ncbi:hypothetical protein HF1_08800 [Mycoplasma haemofelis str. Langford 1]|uniref:Uncharacterized protein n=1 Tax=Mycoplasma haemofelis (strain Langford 1) TaxID=941640 RepID=E8ZIB7_MYCHL|nr:hypothetical protein [Mycoplasma haemofelis]CBY92888.1 hypothetical protein HF1_08800 [Mycoplasma haemofelis str. Langford 1]
MDAKLLGLAGSLGTAAVGGGIYFASKDSPKSTSISHLLESEKGLLLLSETTDAKWQEAWKRYRDAHKEGGSGNYKTEDLWNIKDWASKQKEDSAPEEFKSECEKRAKLEVLGKDGKEYQNVKSWCTRPKKVSELLSSIGNKVLLNKDGDSGEWSKSWEEYRKHHQKQPSGSSVSYEDKDELGVSSWTTKSKETGVPTEYKTACQTKADSYIEIEKVTEDTTFKRVEKWCTKPRV